MKPWVMRMRWLDLLFAHWPVDPDVLAARLPAGLELDLRDGQAWLGIVPFTMAHTNLGRIKVHDRVNLECDMVGKYVVRAAQVAGLTFSPVLPGEVTH